MMTDLRFTLRSLTRVKGLAVTVVLTLALGIGANAAIFSIVRGVLLRPLVNKDEAHLIYIRQSAPGVGTENTTFSVPEIDDLRAGLKNVTGVTGFSTIGFTMVGLGTTSSTVVGVLEPSVPYPSETELIANVVTSPHHMSATMNTGREHRMTELFGRLAAGTELDQARAELTTVYGGMVQAHPEAYQ